MLNDRLLSAVRVLRDFNPMNLNYKIWWNNSNYIEDWTWYGQKLKYMILISLLYIVIYCCSVLYIFFQEAPFPTPTICWKGQDLPSANCQVFLDKCVITRDPMDFSLCVSCLMASYYVYNIAYPKRLQHTLMFLEKYVFMLPTSGKVPPRVSRMRTLLK